MRLTKYGFRLNLLGFSSFLSVLGIFVAIIGIIGVTAIIVIGSVLMDREYGPSASYILYGIGAVILVFKIIYLAMWINLKIKTSKKDFDGIEKIGKIYLYKTGILEIIGFSARIALSIGEGEEQAELIGNIIGATIILIFACLKIHATRVENNKILEAYIVFRYVLFIHHVAIFLTSSLVRGGIYHIVAFVLGSPIVVLDIGITVITHSIRLDREKRKTETSDEELLISEKDMTT